MLKKILKEILFWTWCLPQTLVGLVAKLIWKGQKYNHYYVWTNTSGSISLGKFVFLSENSKDNINTVKHEFGHQKQSFILGPLYLLVIGLPSIIWANFFGKYRQKHNKSYDDFYTERWANKLGGVK